MLSSGLLRLVVRENFTDVSEALAVSIIRRRPEDSHLHTRRRENQESHMTHQVQNNDARWQKDSFVQVLLPLESF
jgi:hypothetical protein